ncbi:suppressor of G2 allele of SKP1 [Cinnamomum micranthum f. kanehirae]|uniref:Protein SGT1 homolog n=1 Tax=Cinnamomum micranthum f. kanehirae TaxID=337451 RepID=A0A443NNV2_9MAGN|nr:suppressor of G2 allele of SKP1 [Cinnamomum micranthum f. kanehirae]
MEAVADSNRAIELDPSMSKAYFRKGSACMKLEEYQTAKAAFEAGAALAPGDSRFAKFIEECDKCIADEMKDTQKSAPNASQGTVLPSVGSRSSDSAAVTVKDTKQTQDTSQHALDKPKYRHEHYQKPDEVVVTIFAKGAQSKNVSVEFGEQILSVSISEDAYHFQPRLFGKIIPEKCRYVALSTKIEIRLAKAEGIHWNSLEFTKDNLVPQKINVSSASERPTYPSSKSRAVDWDKLEAEVKKEEKTEKLDGDAGLNKLFRDIYQDADDDTRRAMRKSFVESNGTVLSTNWKEVGAKKVEGSPPDGMEMKKWEY